jgi:hypothetical protein
VELNESEKYVSLLRCEINYDCKKLQRTGPWWRHDIQHSGTQHKGLICDSQHISTESRYAECHFAM